MKRFFSSQMLWCVVVVAFAVVQLQARTVSEPQRGPIRGRLDDADPNATLSLTEHNIGNTRMTLSNWGEFGNPDNMAGYKGFEWPRGSGNEFLFSAGIWVGAIVNGVRHVSTATDGDNGTNEFWPEHIGTFPSSYPNLDWYASSRILTSFQGRPYVQGIMGVDDDADGRTDEDPPGDMSHDRIDNDHDGLVDMADPNYDGDLNVGFADDDNDGRVDEDAAAWGDQECFAVYQDNIQLGSVRSPDPTGHTPLNIEVLQRTYAWPGEIPQNVIIADYLIRNLGIVPLDDVYVGFFADPDLVAAGQSPDIGSTDDYNYYDPTRTMMLQMDWSMAHAGTGPGIFAVRVLHTPAPLANLRTSFANYARLTGGDPPDDAGKYAVMSSGTIAGFSDHSDDWRMVMAFGDAAQNGFHLAPGGELPITLALIGAANPSDVSLQADRALYMWEHPWDWQGIAPPRNLRMLATSSGTVQLGWSPPIVGTAAYYNLFGRDSAGSGQQVQFNAGLLSDTVFTVADLQNGDDWLFQAQAVDDSGRGSIYNELLVRVAAPAPVTGLRGEMQNGTVSLSWNASPEPNVTGYRVLRRNSAGDSTSFATTLTDFTDNTARRGYVNTYWIVAENSLGVLSLARDSVNLVPFAPQQRILIVDETGGNGRPPSLPVDTVAAFYHRLMDQIGEVYDYAHASALVPDTVFRYDLVIWVNENTNGTSPTNRENLFATYLQAGGRLLRIARHFAGGNLGYAAGMYRHSPVELAPLTFDSMYVSPTSILTPQITFIGGNSASPAFFNFTLDTARLHRLNYSSHVFDYLPQVDLFWPHAPTRVLYTSVVLPDDPSGFANQPCAVIGPQEIVLAFALFFLHESDAQSLLHTCIDVLREPSAVPPDRHVSMPDAVQLYPCYPNPFNPSTVLRFDLVRAGQIRLTIYDILGREVRVLADQPFLPGSHNIRFDASDLASGVYFAQLRGAAFVRTQKLVLLK